MGTLLIFLTGLQAGMSMTALFYAVRIIRLKVVPDDIFLIMIFGILGLLIREVQIIFTFDQYIHVFNLWVVLVNSMMPIAVMTTMRLKFIRLKMAMGGLKNYE